MVSLTTILACIVTLFISLILPLGALFYFYFRDKNKLYFKAFALGALGFFITQMVIRTPLLNLLQSQSWFVGLMNEHLFIYVFSLAITAGLFELVGRFFVGQSLKKELNFKVACMAGLGHGAIEAILIVGITYINNLIYIFMINGGAFDALLVETAAQGMDISQLAAIKTQFLSMPSYIFLLAGYERLLTMFAQITMSLIVMYGIAHKKVLVSLIFCLTMHTILDLSAGLTLIAPNHSYLIIYSFLTLMTLVFIYIFKNIKKHWNAH